MHAVHGASPYVCGCTDNSENTQMFNVTYTTLSRFEDR